MIRICRCAKKVNELVEYDYMCSAAVELELTNKQVNIQKCFFSFGKFLLDF